MRRVIKLEVRFQRVENTDQSTGGESVRGRRRINWVLNKVEVTTNKSSNIIRKFEHSFDQACIEEIVPGLEIDIK